MTRRIHTPVLHEGENELNPIQAHHARDVLRLSDGAEVEVFDNAGRTATGNLLFRGPGGAVVQVGRLDTAPSAERPAGLRWSVASAVPKGERADWMVEKLSELGAEAFIPLAAARSVVLPEGKNKRERWVRIATESAKQSRRRGVMRIDPLTPLPGAVASLEAANLKGATTGWCLSTGGRAVPIVIAAGLLDGRSLTLFIGPEGGWSPEEARLMVAAHLTEVKLTNTILRVETAAIAASAVASALFTKPED